MHVFIIVQPAAGTSVRFSPALKNVAVCAPVKLSVRKVQYCTVPIKPARDDRGWKVALRACGDFTPFHPCYNSTRCMLATKYFVTEDLESWRGSGILELLDIPALDALGRNSG
jgi:hypothetical protein